ncbi:hypothetical protein DPEC_G00246570 [Dallia pectoralis]|uniref:Uncharacterized protein n=1 Tax=Dallia pectoralis TaxID=75939 RepID=A0ACC2FWK8_DALPE|nr:hypothetical protein DPEC_G00246570 [Dallia pectoralis]
MDRLSEWSFKSKKNMEVELGDALYFEYDSEEIANYQEPNELLAALKQKEEEVLLAAQLGNALLLENRQLKAQSDKLHEQYACKLEVLEQGRHDMRVKLEGCQSGWESQVGDLEKDVRDLSGQVDRLAQALCDAERDKTRVQEEHSEHIQLLREQLSTAMEMEKVMTSELQTVKQELQQKVPNNRPEDEEVFSALREQVLRLSQKEQALEERLKSVCQDNTDLRDSLASLHTQLSLQEQQNSQQLTEAWMEAEAARGRSQQLQVQVEELQEEISLQHRSSYGNTSLLSELESSLDTMGLGPDREQVTQEVRGILELLQPLILEVKHSVGSNVLDQEEDDLQTVLLQLKSVAQNLAKDIHSHQISQLQEEIAELKLRLENCLDTDETKQAIRDRDDAIAKKNLMEAELMRSKNDMMCLNNQLLEAIQRKLELSQELEAWQDDIQIIINQQLRTQQQSEKERLVRRSTVSSAMSFWRRPSTVSSTRVRWAPTSSATCTPESLHDKPLSPWKDWLRRGKVAEPSK